MENRHRGKSLQSLGVEKDVPIKDNEASNTWMTQWMNAWMSEGREKKEKRWNVIKKLRKNRHIYKPYKHQHNFDVLISYFFKSKTHMVQFFFSLVFGI